METLEKRKQAAVAKTVREYFRVLENDGVIMKGDVNEADIAYLVGQVLEAIYREEVLEMEAVHEAALETMVGEPRPF